MSSTTQMVNCGFAEAVSMAYGGRDADDVVRGLARELYWQLGGVRPPFRASDYARLLSVPVFYRDIPTEGAKTDTDRLSLIAARREGDLTREIEGMLGLDKVSGPVIVLKRPTRSEHGCVKYRRNFTLAHELGHFVMRQAIAGFIPEDSLPFNDSEEERLANLFASEVLMPAERLMADLRRIDFQLDQLIGLSAKYEVSLKSFLVRVQHLADGHFAFLLHKRKNKHVELEWTTPRRFDRILLSEGARYRLSQCFDTSEKVEAVQEFILKGKICRWETEMARLPDSDSLVLTWLKKDLRNCSIRPSKWSLGRATPQSNARQLCLF